MNAEHIDTRHRSPSTFFAFILKRLPISFISTLIIMYYLVSCPAAISAQQHTDFKYNFGAGPFSLTSNSPGPSLRLTALPLVPSRISPGDVDINVGTSWANVWANERAFFFDYEMFDSHLSISYGMSNRWMIGVTFNQRTFFGGALDSSIIEFHDFFGIDQDGRQESPRNNSSLLLLDANGNTVADLGSANVFNNSSIKLMSSYILTPGTGTLPAISLSGMVQYGLETPFADDDESLDVSVGLGFSKRWSARWISYHTLNYNHYGQTKMPYLTFEENGFSATNALAWEKGPHLSFLVQYMYHKGVIKDVGSLSDATHEIGFGFKWRLRKKGVIEFGIVENIINYANSSDFGIHAAYTQAFH